MDPPPVSVSVSVLKLCNIETGIAWPHPASIHLCPVAVEPERLDVPCAEELPPVGAQM